ncbi:uncharacterized protein BJ171DRAFT_599769 [Polychytrium aggregatum]|uniref:uncharacterized protein n=1 Tax=Polychytrium aggregatum TaxID=110093 RepID=UPI0022FE9A4E|nr:uncharacterized protein BJ171DRAFT_599769 [Polychytrium aggregatum]KAI9203870.1 hypothetical protein BJ171DRAFT_599769 [Polychytrium aggregatum]
MSLILTLAIVSWLSIASCRASYKPVLLDTTVNLTITSDVLEVSEGYKTTVGIPALFGVPLTETQAFPIYPLSTDACEPFSVTLPNNKDSRFSNIIRTQPHNLSASEEASLGWLALVMRGKCPFDVKVLNIQKAGFAGAVIYNDGRRSLSGIDLPVRMAASSEPKLQDQIHIWSIFISHFQGLLLKEAHTTIQGFFGHQSRLVVTASPGIAPSWYRDNADHFTHGDSGFWGDIFFLVTVFVLCGWASILTCLVVTICRNYLLYRRIIIYELQGPPVPPKLKTVDLPIKVITNEDLDARRSEESLAENERLLELGLSIGKECCAICIEEFECGSRVRELPCRHYFHDTCVDPWLTKHTRLCPICKQDVVELQAGTSSGSGSETTLASGADANDNIGTAATQSSRTWIGFFREVHRSLQSSRHDNGERREGSASVPNGMDQPSPATTLLSTGNDGQSTVEIHS